MIKRLRLGFRSFKIPALFLFLMLSFSSCNRLQLPKEDYVKGKGYCVKKYDEGGCNICKLDYEFDIGWGWKCTEKACPDLPKENENSNRCLEYKSRKDLIFSAKK